MLLYNTLSVKCKYNKCLDLTGRCSDLCDKNCKEFFLVYCLLKGLGFYSPLVLHVLWKSIRDSSTFFFQLRRLWNANYRGETWKMLSYFPAEATSGCWPGHPDPAGATLWVNLCSVLERVVATWMDVNILSFKQIIIAWVWKALSFQKEIFLHFTALVLVLCSDILLSSLHALHSPIPQVLTTLPPIQPGVLLWTSPHELSPFAATVLCLHC